MSPRDAETDRIARELREIQPDPLDWWEGPRMDRRKPMPAFSAWGAVALGIMGTAILYALVVLVLLLVRWLRAMP